MTNESFFRSPAWTGALTLAERAALPGAPTYFDAEVARERLAAWRSQPPFSSDGWLARRLSLQGLNEESALPLLGENGASLLERLGGMPDWLAAIERAFAESEEDPEPLPSPRLGGRRRPEFLNLVEPLLRSGYRRFLEGARALGEETTGELFFPNLARQLWVPLSRTLVLELHVAGLEGRLAGSTPEERFSDFAAGLRRPEVALNILATYPVLARMIVGWIDQWAAFSLEFLTHLRDDREALREVFGVQGKITAVEAGAGDFHRGGRSVLMVDFEDGWRLVYKPRSLAVEARFQELLEWLGFDPGFRPLRVLDRGSHGWAEFVAAAPCESAEEVGRFYERQGGYLALLYALDAADFHAENLIAAGEHPVLVDLEAMFHPRIDGRDLHGQGDLPGEGAHRSVLRVGLLPQRIWGNIGDDGEDGVDVSGLAAAPGQWTPRPVLQLEDAGTDRMRFERQRVEMGGARNRPMLNGEAVSLSDYAGALEAGFTRMLRLILARKDELPLTAFADAEVRVIVRPTSTYDGLLVESFHPDVLGNALRRDALLDRLWSAVERRPFLARLIPAERADLERGDIPLFTTRPGSRDLWTASGERIADVFDSSGLDRVRARLRTLSEHDLSLQLWMVRSSLATVALAGRRDHWVRRSVPEMPEPPGRDRLLAAARAIGERLEEKAFRGRRDALWFALTTRGPVHWSFQPVGLDLYDGLPGIVLFLAHLGAVTGEDRFTGLARAGLASIREGLDRTGGMMGNPGAFSGLGGLIHAFTHLGALWGEPELLDEAERCADSLPDLLEKDESGGVIDGAAGCAVVLLGLHGLRPSERVLDAARLCGERLLALARPMETGGAWVYPPAGPRPLSGVAHGAAGIAWALLKLAAATGDARFRRAALEGIAYERSLFRPEEGNWLDLRPGEASGEEAGDGRFTWGWCNGAPGIGLTRLDALPHLDGSEAREEIEAAVGSTLARGLGASHSLCHGDLGNLDFLLEAGRRLGDRGLIDRVHRLAAGVLAAAEGEGWRQGAPIGGDLPGLMAGLAGIGYGLLRLADPDRVPSVLLLEPSRRTARPARIIGSGSR